MRKLAALVSLWLAADAGAGGGGAVFAVDSTLDAVDALPGDAICATAGGDCTLRAAIQESNALVGSDLIQVPAGSYALTLTGAGEDLAATGDLDVRDSVVIVGGDGGTTSIDGGETDRVLHVQPMSGATLTVVIDSVTIRGGASAESGGGGILHEDEGALVVLNSVVTANRVVGSGPAAAGGGVASAGTGDLEIRNSVVSDNVAQRGGAIFTNGTLILSASTVRGNTSVTGGAVASYGATEIERCAFWGNHGASIDANDGSVVLSNSTVSGDAAALAVLEAGAASFAIENVTVADVTGQYVLLALGPVSVANSVLTGATIGPTCSVVLEDAITSLGGNLDDDGSCIGAGPGDLPAQDPLLGPLADNGGPTLTHLPQPASPLANAGRAASCPSDDQRGVAREVGPANGCDIGAVEFAVPEPSALALGATALAALAHRRKFTPGV